MAGKGQWRQDGSAAGGPVSRACLRHARDPEVARLRERARVVALWLDVELHFGRARKEAMRGALPWDDASRILLLLRQIVGTPVAAPAPDPEE